MPCSGPLVAAAAQRLVELLDARLPGALDGQVDDRARRDGRADGEAVQLALQLGDHQPDRLGGAGRGGDQVDRGGAGPAQVLVGHVLQPLVGRVGVDRRHQAMADADRVVEHLRDRRQAVGRAGGVGDHVVGRAVVDLARSSRPARPSRPGRSPERRSRPSSPRPARCLAALARSVKRPVDSITTSTPSSPHGSAPGSRSASTFSSTPSTSIASSPLAWTVPG